MARTSPKNAHKVRKPIVRGPYDRVRSAISFDPKEGLTHQSFKDECDITRIVETYARTGIIPNGRWEPVYGDAPESSLFEAACAQAAIRTAEEEGFEYSPEAASEAPEEPISETQGDTEGSPEKAASAASEPAEPTSRGEPQ